MGILKKKSAEKESVDVELVVGGRRSVSEVVSWLETHGIERGTAAQVQGFLRAYDISLPQIALCNYGLTYTFAEFAEWFYAEKEDYSPRENTICIFWNDDNAQAIIGVLSAKVSDSEFPYNSFDGGRYKHCMRFDTLSQYRQLLNTPNGDPVALPQADFEGFTGVEKVSEEEKEQ